MDPKTKEALNKKGLSSEPVKFFTSVQIKAKAFEYLRQECDYLLDSKKSDEELTDKFTTTAITVFDFLDLLLGEEGNER